MGLGATKVVATLDVARAGLLSVGLAPVTPKEKDTVRRVCWGIDPPPGYAFSSKSTKSNRERAPSWRRPLVPGAREERRRAAKVNLRAPHLGLHSALLCTGDTLLHASGPPASSSSSQLSRKMACILSMGAIGHDNLSSRPLPGLWSLYWLVSIAVGRLAGAWAWAEC